MLESPSLGRSVASYAQLLHQSGYVANHDGNISCRMADDKRFLATPTAMSKRFIEAHDLITVDIEGKILAGRRKLFSEWHLHAACYKARPDVRAVIHAHPVTATAFGLARRSLGVFAMPEPIVSLGKEVPLISYALPKSSSQDAEIENALKSSNAMLIAGNGVLTVGTDLEQAFLRLELVEHYAKILMNSLLLSGLQPAAGLQPAVGPQQLPEADIQKLISASKSIP